MKKEEGLENSEAPWHLMCMQNNTGEPMDASKPFCPNEACSARGQIGAGNISIHGRKRPRYKCHHCGKTFGARKGTMFEGVRTDEEKVALVVTLLSYSTNCATRLLKS